MNALQVFLVPAMLMASWIAPGTAHCEVYVNWAPELGDPQAEPFIVGHGDTYRSVLATDESHISVEGGVITNVWQMFSRSPVRAIDRASVDISGGQMRVYTGEGVHSGTPALHFQDFSSGRITGGVFEGFGRRDRALVVRSNAHVDIYGGRFISHQHDALYSRSGTDSVIINIHGGVFDSLGPWGYDLHVPGGTVNIFAKSAAMGDVSLTSGAIPEDEGAFSVVYLDGSAEEFSFFSRPDGIINLVIVPEPCSLACALVAAICTTTRRTVF